MSTFKKVLAVVLVMVFAVAAVASARSVFARSYVGRTSQGMAVSLKLPKSRKSVKVTIRVQHLCPALGGTITGPDQFKVPVSRRGKYHDAWDDTEDFADDPSIGQGNLTDRVTGSEAGSLGAKKARGTYRERLTIIDGNGATVGECDTGTITYSARATK